MIIRIEDLKNISQTILAAVDNNELSIITETLELVVTNKTLFMNVTNREYYAQVKLNIDEDENLHATVNANLFLKLISQITTDTVEFNVSDSYLHIKANGNYKIPLIYDDDKLLQLPTIDLNNVTTEMDISGETLLSIAQYNSKQLNTGTISKPVQKMYYVDDTGAITFTSGACVNTFKLDKPVKILLNGRLVKLFKLFKGSKVHFKLAYDSISDDITQTKVSFESDNIVLRAILSCDDSMISSVPVTAIRARATADYPHSVNLNRDAFIESINRLMLFTSVGKNTNAYCKFTFATDNVIITDFDGENLEKLVYNNDTTNIDDNYVAALDLTDIKSVLDTCAEQYITVKFGDSQAIAICRGNIVNIIPELHV